MDRKVHETPSFSYIMNTGSKMYHTFPRYRSSKNNSHKTAEVLFTYKLINFTTVTFNKTAV